MELLGTILEQGFQLDLVAIECGTAPFPWPGLLMAGPGDGIGLRAGDKVVARGAKARDHLACGIERIGDEVVWILERDDAKQQEHLVEQGATVAIGPPQTFMDAHGQRHRENGIGCPHEHADCLQGMSHYVFGLGVVAGFLVQQLHARHLLAALRHLDAVAYQHTPAIHANRVGEQFRHRAGPQPGQAVDIDGLAVKALE